MHFGICKRTTVMNAYGRAFAQYPVLFLNSISIRLVFLLIQTSYYNRFQQQFSLEVLFESFSFPLVLKVIFLKQVKENLNNRKSVVFGFDLLLNNY